jgi:hypothetical protein
MPGLLDRVLLHPAVALAWVRTVREVVQQVRDGQLARPEDVVGEAARLDEGGELVVSASVAGTLVEMVVPASQWTWREDS